MLATFFRNSPFVPDGMTPWDVLERIRTGNASPVSGTLPSGERISVAPDELEPRHTDPDFHRVATDRASATILPERWGIIASIVIDGMELLYADLYDSTLLDAKKSVKWGLPRMFPNAGPIIPEKQRALGTDLPQHGFGRLYPWTPLPSARPDEFIQELRATDIPERYGYPRDWTATETVRIGSDGSVSFSHRLANLGETPLRLSSWLHPYFRVPLGRKADIVWDFEWGAAIAAAVGDWADDRAFFTDWPRDGIVRARIPGLGTLVLTASADYRRLWIWSLPGKNFVCIEPSIGHYDGLHDSPLMVAPGETAEQSLEVRLEK